MPRKSLFLKKFPVLFAGLALISGALAQTAPQASPFRNPVLASDLSEIPGDIQDRLVQMGTSANIPALTALYGPLFPGDLFAGMNVSRNLAYGSAERNVLDIVAPGGDGGEPRPVVVFVHGGGFGGGNKSAEGSPFYDNIPYWAASKGLVGVNVNYRYAPANPWPAGIEDMRALVAWLKENVAQYGGDPGRIYLWGKSTGASHVADYMADVAKKGEKEQIAGAIFTSGFFALGATPAWENYYGSDVSLYPERNALPGLLRSRTPIMASYAEFDGAMYRDQFTELVTAMNGIGEPITALYLRGHSHMSETYAVGTGDESLTGPVLEFIRNTPERRRAPVQNRVTVSDLAEVPAEIEAQLVQMGVNANGGALNAIYRPLFRERLFAGMNLFRNIPYGPAERNVLDVATSGTGLSNRPVLVFVHGGGFGAGNKSAEGSPFYDNITAWAASKGLVGVNVNYRYAPASQWPSGIEDMRAAVAWIRDNIAAYGGDPNRIFLWGKSTGASHVVDYMADVAEKGEREQIAGAVLTSGFYALGDTPAWENYYGSDVSRYAEMNAMPGLLRSGTPVMATYAEFDGDMYKEQFTVLLRAMNEAGNPMETLYLRGHNHLSETYAVGTGDESLSSPVLEFIRRVGGK